MHAPAPPRPIAYAAPRIVCEQAADGSLRCRSAEPLASHDPSLARLFRAAVERNPGREIRIMVRPDDVDDIGAAVLARDVAKRIEEELTYPGQIRVTVVRESRATEVAR